MNFFAPHIPDETSHSGTDRLSVSIVRSLGEMVLVADGWQELDNASLARHVYFQSYDWCHAWWTRQSRPGQELAIHVVRSGSRVIAVLPLMKVRTALGGSILRVLGEPHTQYANILTCGSTLAEVAKPLLWKALRSNGADLLLFNCVPRCSALQDFLGDRSDAPELANVSLQFDLTVYEDGTAYDRCADRKTRQLRRRADTYLSKNGPLSLRVLRPGDADFAGAIANCIAMKMVWIHETARNQDGLGQADHAGFLSSLKGGEQMSGSIVFALYSGDTPIAYQIGFLQRGHYYLYTAGFDWNLRTWSPGTVLIDMTIRWLIDNRAQTFDMMGNPAGYKERLANRQVALSGHAIALSLRGTLQARLWTRIMRPVLRQIYLGAPVPVRRSVNWVRQLRSA